MAVSGRAGPVRETGSSIYMWIETLSLRSLVINISFWQKIKVGPIGLPLLHQWNFFFSKSRTRNNALSHPIISPVPMKLKICSQNSSLGIMPWIIPLSLLLTKNYKSWSHPIISSFERKWQKLNLFYYIFCTN